MRIHLLFRALAPPAIEQLLLLPLCGGCREDMETYGRIKQASAHAEEHPHIHHQAESKYETDVQQHTCVRRLCQTVVLPLPSRRHIAVHCSCVGYLGTAKRKEQEHKRPCKLRERCNDFVAPEIVDIAVEGILAVRSVWTVVAFLFARWRGRVCVW
jgi:hypothetical protein